MRGCCAAVFAAAGWMPPPAAKAATTDEPSHAAIGWLMTWRHDYRISPDVPPLWEYLRGTDGRQRCDSL